MKITINVNTKKQRSSSLDEGIADFQVETAVITVQKKRFRMEGIVLIPGKTDDIYQYFYHKLHVRG